MIAMRRDHEHDGARPWRGVKRDQWEGGHRTPFIVKWPGKIKPASTSDQITSLTDIFATCAAITGAEFPNEAAEDSHNMLPVLDGTQGDKPVRPYMLQQTMSLALSVRRGDWKLLDHKGSGGNNYTRGGEWGMKQYAIPDNDPDSAGSTLQPGHRSRRERQPVFETPGDRSRTQITAGAVEKIRSQRPLTTAFYFRIPLIAGSIAFAIFMKPSAVGWTPSTVHSSASSPRSGPPSRKWMFASPATRRAFTKSS